MAARSGEHGVTQLAQRAPPFRLQHPLDSIEAEFPIGRVEHLHQPVARQRQHVARLDSQRLAFKTCRLDHPQRQARRPVPLDAAARRFVAEHRGMAGQGRLAGAVFLEPQGPRT